MRLDEHTLTVVARQLAQRIRSGSLAPEAVALRTEEGMTAALVAFARSVEESVTTAAAATDDDPAYLGGVLAVGGSAATPAPELRNDDRGQLDDVVIPNVALFRLERMDKDAWWMRLYMPNREDYVFQITTSGREITITAETEKRDA